MRAAVLTCALVGLFFVEEASSECPAIRRRPQDTNCNYYCRNQDDNGWEEGFLLNGETCNYVTENDGVCSEGICYKATVPSPTEPSPPVGHSEEPSDDDPMTPQPPKKKKKKSPKTKKPKKSKDKKSKKGKKPKKGPREETEDGGPGFEWS